MERRRRAWLLWLCFGAIASAGSWALANSSARVRAPVASVREQPNGSKLGELLEGAEVERLGQDGKWVRVRIEGWIWGPELEGFAVEPAATEPSAEAAAAPWQAATTRIRRLVAEHGGTFYSIAFDSDLGCLTLRLRVGPVEPEALAHKQMRIQRELLDVLGGQMDIRRIRVESNRTDGGGRVGTEIAETAVADLRGLSPEDIGAWRRASRISHDGGSTWESSRAPEPADR